MDLSQEVHDAAQHVTAATGTTLANALNGFIGRFVGWPFKAAPGFVRDRDGNQTETFASVIHTAPENTGGTDADAFRADAVAAVIDARIRRGSSSSPRACDSVQNDARHDPS